MLSSKFYKTVLTLGLLVILAGCSGLQLVSDSEAEDKTQIADQKEAEAQEGVGATKEGEVEGQTAPEAESVKRIAAVDPMKDKDVSLDLIKLYDQVKGMIASKKIEEAISILESSKSAFPNSSGPSYRLARLYLQKKDYEKALDAVETAVSIEQSNYYAINLKGVILREQGKFQEAKAAYTKALEVYPDYANGHLNLAILADIYLYDLDLALTHYETYMLLTGDTDKQAAGWLIDLKRRMPSGAE